jgi:hypothetical protein
MKRRTVVTAIGASIVSISGCSGQLLGTGGALDLRVSNETSNSLTASISVVASDEGMFDKTISLEPNGGQNFADVVGDESATITVSVEDGPEATHEFADDSTEAHGVFIDIYTDRIEFQNYSK